MEARGAVILAGIILGCSIASPAVAYDEQTTHPALTDEIITLHNRLYPEDAVTEDERSLMLRGSTDEDIVPRSLNHLYDPVHHTGWNGLHAGWAPQFLTKLVSMMALVPDAPLANVEWITADSVQRAYVRYGGNRSWPAAIRALGRDDRDAAYQDLGSVLHLLEDAGVPDHARDDTHVHQIDFLTGDSGSPFESYTARYVPGSLNMAAQLRVTKGSIPRYAAPRDYLEELARFSADSFFSKDTVLDPRFPKPVVTREQDGVVYGKTRDGQEVPLARRVAAFFTKTGATSTLRLGSDSEYDRIHEVQFRIIAEKTILLGVGLVRDFKESQRKASEAPKSTAVVLSLAGEADRIADTIAGWLGGSARVVAQQASRAYAWLTGALPSVASNDPQNSAPIAEPVATPSEIGTASVSTKTAAKTGVKKATSTTVQAPQSTAVTQARCTPSTRPEVVISEVAWMGTTVSANDEWIELENRGPDAATLRGWELADSEGGLYIDLDAVTIPAHGFALLERTDDASVPNVRALAIYTGGLANAPSAGFALELQAAGCGVIDRVTTGSKGWPGGDAASRRTLERTSRDGWQTSAQPGGTPGRANSAGYVKTTTATSTQHATTTTEEDEEEDEDEESETPFEIDMGRMVLSEIRAAGADAGDEFVELYNPEDRDVSLEGWSLQYFAATETAMAQKRDLPAESVPAHGYFLVVREKNGAVDGYQGTTSADFAHRSYALSGAGATVALVRGSEKVVSTSDAAVVDAVRYPKLLAYESYERAAAGNPACLDPRSGAAGEFAGNGCIERTWYVRPAADPQNRTSLAEPREGTPHTTSTDDDPPQGEVWLSLPAIGYRELDTVQDWKALAVFRGTSTPAGSLTTATNLDPGAGALSLKYAACYGGEALMRLLLIPLTPISCQNGGGLSGALAGAFWEDNITVVRALADLIPGEVLHLAEYAFSGGGGGEQRFSLTGIFEYVFGEDGRAPDAPTGLAVDMSRLPRVRVTWDTSVDADNLDETLGYLIRLSHAGNPGAWVATQTERSYEAEVESGTYTVEVRARDAQGHDSAIAQEVFVVPEPVASEQFLHDDELLQGSGTLRVATATQLKGLAIWLVPQGGPFCCSNARLTVEDAQGTQVAMATGGRRTVDGDGDTELHFESPVALGPGSYRLSIVDAGGTSNGIRLKGKRGIGDWNGTDAVYLRLVKAP